MKSISELCACVCVFETLKALCVLPVSDMKRIPDRREWETLPTQEIGQENHSRESQWEFPVFLLTVKVLVLRKWLCAV